jgi:sarcosine oxidase subunit gamma
MSHAAVHRRIGSAHRHRGRRPRARDLLAKGTSIDLHPRLFGPGRCVQTGFAGANIVLRQIDEVPSFEILVPNSFAEHLWSWLEGGAREYRVAVSVL